MKGSRNEVRPVFGIVVWRQSEQTTESKICGDGKSNNPVLLINLLQFFIRVHSSLGPGMGFSLNKF